MEVSDVRRRVRIAIEKAKHDSAERRAHAESGARDYEVFLAQIAIPLFHQVASALVADGHPFKVFTPVGSVRLSSDRSPGDFIELAFDDGPDRPQVVGRANRGRGRQVISSERPIRENAAIAELTEDDLLSYILDEVTPMLVR